jgi:hypothetical protein
MKTVSVKVYSPAGVFLKLWTTAIFEGFSKELNSGLGECVLKLAEKFDYAGQELQEGNMVKIFVCDRETISQPNGELLIYSGYISQIEPTVDFSKEYIMVRLLGYSTLLALDILKNGAQTTLYSNNTTGLSTSAPSEVADVGHIMRAVIDRYRAETVSPQISYDQASIPLTSTTQQYVFYQRTYKEAMDELRLLAPVDYYFFIDEAGLVTLKLKPTTPTHTFVLGKHFSSIRAVRSIETVRNFLLLWDGRSAADGGIYRHYQDDISIAQYRRQAERITNYGLQDTGGFDAIGNKFIAENKDVDISVTFDILDNNDETRLQANGQPMAGYDIESIQVGDTCKFLGFNNSLADIFKENMLITKIDYRLSKVSVTIKLSRTSVVDWTKMNEKNIDNTMKGNDVILTSYS